jgi:Big-like domain-containing protein/CHRD domain-containing protein
MRDTLRFTRAFAAVALLAAGALAAILSACGGGYGGGGGGSGGGMTCGSGYSNTCPAPTITLTAPAAGATVSGTVALTATASASSTYGLTVTSVEFLIDGNMVGTVTSSPYTYMWNSTTVTAGSHSLTAKVTDSAGGTATTPAIMINTTGMATAAVAMSPAQIFPGPMSHASGMAELTVKLDSGATRGTVKLTGLRATSVSINEGFAGASGPALIRLTPSGEEAAEWRVPANALLTAEQLTALSQGKLYVIATSAANPRGEIRGQITPDNVAVTFSALAPAAETRSVSPAAAGVVATTVDKNAHMLSVHVNSTGVDDADAAEVGSAAGGRKLAALGKDSVDMGHWSTELVPISAADVGHFEAGKWYVSIATPVELNGALRGQVNAPRD